MTPPRHNPGRDIRTDVGSPPVIQTPSISPDLYVAGLAAATQVYIDRTMVKGRPTAAAIDALVRQSAFQQKLSASMAAAIHTYLLTSPDASGVVAQSAALGSRVLDYAKTHKSTDPSRPTTLSGGILDSPQPAHPVTLARDGGTGSNSGSPQQLTGPQAAAAASAANHAAPKSDAIESDELGNALVSIGFGIGALGADLGEVIFTELEADFLTNLDDTIITLSPNDAEAPDRNKRLSVSAPLVNHCRAFVRVAPK